MARVQSHSHTLSGQLSPMCKLRTGRREQRRSHWRAVGRQESQRAHLTLHWTSKLSTVQAEPAPPPRYHMGAARGVQGH